MPKSARKPQPRSSKPDLHCSFCGKSAKEVSSLVAGGAIPGVHICGPCIGVAARIVEGLPTEGFANWQTADDDQLLANLSRALAANEGARAVLQQQIDELRRREVSWERIGGALGVTRQTAWERFG